MSESSRLKIMVGTPAYNEERITALGVLGIMGYAIVKPKLGQKFTEFYILGLGGMIADYPKELKVGEIGVVPIVITRSIK